MANNRNHPAAGPSASRSARSSLERSTQSIGRSALDFANRRTVARPAPAIWAVPNGASALPELGARWDLGAGAAQIGRAPQRSGRTGFERMFCGRNVCSGQKRGRLVGKTKRGKGTKIMGIADGHGLPLALRAESASPAEVKLVEAT